MVAAEGDLMTFFTTAIHPSALHQIPDIVHWAQDNVDRVHGLAFTVYRASGADRNVAQDHAGREVNASRPRYSTVRFDR
jgi:hypothetical protein